MFDPKDFSGVPVTPRMQQRAPGLPRRRRTGTGRYLRGPIPLDWLAAIGRLPGRALHVALVLWFIASVESRRSDLALRPSVLEDFGVDRYAAYRALAQLEAAGLVTVQRARGRAPVVTILDAPALETISETEEGSQ